MKRKKLQGEFDFLPNAESLLTVICDVLTRQSDRRTEYSFTLTQKNNEDGQSVPYVSR